MNNAKFKLPKYSQVAIYLHKHLEHYHQMCQMPNIWHLTHQTPIFKVHEMFQISKFFIICLFTVSLSYIHSDSISLFSHLKFLLYARHFFSLAEATDIATNLATAADLATPSSLSFFSSLILKPLKLILLEAASPGAADLAWSCLA